MVTKILTISPFGPFCPCKVGGKKAKAKHPFSLVFLGSTNYFILCTHVIIDFCHDGYNSEFITIIGIIIITIIILFIAKMTVNYQLLPNNFVQGFGGSKPAWVSITQTFVRNKAKLTDFPSKPMGPWKRSGRTAGWWYCEGTKQLQFSCLDKLIWQCLLKKKKTIAFRVKVKH